MENIGILKRIGYSFCFSKSKKLASTSVLSSILFVILSTICVEGTLLGLSLGGNLRSEPILNNLAFNIALVLILNNLLFRFIIISFIAGVSKICCRDSINFTSYKEYFKLSCYAVLPSSIFSILATIFTGIPKILLFSTIMFLFVSQGVTNSDDVEF